MFSELQLIEPILKALSQEGYSKPTPIQEKAIPAILEKRDLLACAQTGTGKTAAFAIPLLQHLHLQSSDKRMPPHGRLRTLILTPTRELAIQIDENLKAYGRHLSLKHHAIFGGVSQFNQVKAIKQGLDILVATPGRLLDLLKQRQLSLESIRFFVLDEADRMLDMGFVRDVHRIIGMLPAEKQTLLFSATMPPEIQQMANSLLKNPVKIEITPPATTVELINQSLYYVEKQNKQSLLNHLLNNNEIRSALVFARTKFGADRIARNLTKSGIRTEAIHGNKSQGSRQSALNNFRSGKTRILVATDIAARGIDIDELSHVINYELPHVPETYVHRIGRTGRAGASGVAISFCDYEEKLLLKDIQRLIRKNIPVVTDHLYDNQNLHPVNHISTGNSHFSFERRKNGQKKRHKPFQMRRA